MFEINNRLPETTRHSCLPPFHSLEFAFLLVITRDNLESSLQIVIVSLNRLGLQVRQHIEKQTGDLLLVIAR